MTTLIALKTEAALLSALDAEDALAEMERSTCLASDVISVGRSILALVDSALRALPARLAEAIADEQEESKVGYLLADALHDELGSIGEAAERATTQLPDFGKRFRRGARPRDLLTVSQWADRYRWLSSGTNAPGPWRTSLTPYLRDIMDDLSEHSPVARVVVKKGSGTGGTEGIIYNWIGYVMHHLGNKDMLCVVSTIDMRDRSFNPRLGKMLRETPVLNDILVRSMASRSARGSASILEYSPLARLIKAGANSADSLSSDHIPYVMLDEVDRYPWDVGGEGDPITLIANRTRNFTRAKMLLVSTPTNEHQSRIDLEYEASDGRRLYVPCPHCGHYQALERERFMWRVANQEESGPKVVDSAWFVCEKCGDEIRERDKPDFLELHRWVADRPWVKRCRGYLLPSCYTPIGLGLSWIQLAERLENSSEADSARKAVLNTDWAEVYKADKESVDDHALMARREDYTLDALLVSGRIDAVTAWADVQKDRLEVTIVAWAEDDEAWIVNHIILAGPTIEQEVWDQYDAVLDECRVDFAGVDAGYNTKMAREFCDGKKWCTPTKGMPGFGRPITQDKIAITQRLRRTNKAGRPVEPIGVDQAKRTLFERLSIPSPGPGYLHFPRLSTADREYFEQIAAEELERRRIGGRVEYRWVLRRTRNEALDCLVGNLAIRQLARTLGTRAARRVGRVDAMRGGEAKPPMENTDVGEHGNQSVRRSSSGITLDGWRR